VVGLFICHQDHSKGTELVFSKLAGGMEHWPGKTPLNFEPGILLLSLKHCHGKGVQSTECYSSLSMILLIVRCLHEHFQED